jgi:hypothetical protein
MFVSLSHAIESSFVECWLPVAMIKKKADGNGAMYAGVAWERVDKKRRRYSILALEFCSTVFYFEKNLLSF